MMDAKNSSLHYAEISDLCAQSLEMLHAADVAAGDVVLICGADLGGLIALKACMDRGAKCIVADECAARLKHAEDLGAAAVCTSFDKELEEACKPISDEGFNVILDMLGRADLAERYVQLISQTGRIACANAIPGNAQYNMAAFSRKEAEIIGVRPCAERREAALKWIESHRALVEKYESLR